MALTTDDIKALEQMLAHKLHDVPLDKKPCMYTVAEIIDGTQDLYRPYTA